MNEKDLESICKYIRFCNKHELFSSRYCKNYLGCVYYREFECKKKLGDLKIK